MSIPTDSALPSQTDASAIDSIADEKIVVDAASSENLPTFADFGLADPIARAVVEMGYTIPTPIQAQAIPIVMQGRDVMGAAQTGTGKTAGFALPILQRLMRHANTSASPARHPVRALILAPTRELADQIYENVHKYARYSGLRSAVVFGGVDIQPQIAALRRGAEVLIATPGRLLDHVGQKTVNLSLAEVLVLDEADRMLDMGFLPDIQRIIQLLPKQRQNLMFSATFSRDIRKLAESFLDRPVLIEVARRNAAADNVEQQVYKVADVESKRGAVAQLIRERSISQVIVFTNTKIGASRLARQLERDGLNAAAIHGDKSQQERLATLDAFKKGEISVLVATDVAARGLDIAELPAVINYDLPYAPEDYVHRIGRTGRAGASGLALSLMTANDERLRADIQKLINRQLPPTDLYVAGGPADDRGERGDRPRAARGASEERGRGDRSARARPSRDRGADGARRDPPQGSTRIAGQSIDPFFFEPYEPKETGPQQTAAPKPADAGRRSDRRQRGPIPALLGGLNR